MQIVSNEEETQVFGYLRCHFLKYSMCLSSIGDTHSIYGKSEALLCFGMNTGASGKLLLEAGSVEQPTLHQCVSVYMSEYMFVLLLTLAFHHLNLRFKLFAIYRGILCLISFAIRALYTYEKRFSSGKTLSCAC